MLIRNASLQQSHLYFTRIDIEETFTRHIDKLQHIIRTIESQTSRCFKYNGAFPKDFLESVSYETDFQFAPRISTECNFYIEIVIAGPFIFKQASSKIINLNLFCGDTKYLYSALCKSSSEIVYQIVFIN